LELDELWSFIHKKTHKKWIWIALSRRTRQVVAYAIGDRSLQTFQKLWEAIPDVYRSAHCYSDFWAAYGAVLLEEQHTAVGIRSGQTACGALELHVAAADGSIGEADFIILKV
jgi:IS1 family transposase